MVVSLLDPRRNKRYARLLQTSVAAFGVILVVWSVTDRRFRDGEGALGGGFALLLALSMASVLAGWGLIRKQRSFAFWLALGLTGQAAALQLIEAGKQLRYQHYKSMGGLLEESHPLLLALLALQFLLVTLGIIKRWPQIRDWVARNFRAWQLVGIGLVFVFTSATVSRQASVYASELLLASAVQAVNLGNIVLAVWALPEGTLVSLKRKLDSLLGASAPESEKSSAEIDRFVLLAAAWVVGLAALLSLLVYERHPHIQDEVIYYFHARYLAEGRLSVPAPPTPDAFLLYLIPYRADSWYSIFPPGWPAVLGSGMLLGVPWLINPLLAGLNLILTYLFLHQLYDQRTARMGVLLLCASPWFVFMAMNFMAHTLALTFALVGALAVMKARRTGRAVWSLAGGLSVGALSLVRPFDAAILAGLLGVWALGLGGKRLRLRAIAAFVLGAVLVGSIVLPYNRRLTGNSAVFPLVAYYEDYFGPKVNALGFGPERGLGWAIDALPGHSPLEALVNANLNLFSINVELFGWGTGSLIPIAFLLFLRSLDRRDYLMLGAVLSVAVGFSLYWFSGGPDFGARYWYLVIVPLLALAVRGVWILERRIQDTQPEASLHGTRVIAGVLALSVLSLVNFFPWRALDKYHNYLGMRPDVRDLAVEYGFGRSLVLVQGELNPDYQSAWVFNPLDPHADEPIYAWDRNRQVRAQVIEAYSDRSVWLVAGPTVTGGGFSVIDGPLTAREVLSGETGME